MNVRLLNVRLLPYEVADGPGNMARDEALLQSAVENQIASLRFYGWSSATVSLGYFQPAAGRLSDARLKELPWVRRPTGGGTLVHDREVTYALALHPDSLWRVKGGWFPGIHALIWDGLRGRGVRRFGMVTDVGPRGGGLFFRQHTWGDVLCQGSKVVGSAQPKHRQ